MSIGFTWKPTSCSSGNIGPIFGQVDSMGRGYIRAKANDTITQDYMYQIGMSSLGWGATALASLSTAWMMVGYANKALASNTYGEFLVMGYNPSCNGHASGVRTSGYQLRTEGASITSAALVTATVAFATFTFGVITDTTVATTVFGAILFGERFHGNQE